MKGFIKTAISLLFIFGLHLSANAANCTVTLEKLLKEAQMNEEAFTIKPIHHRLLEVASTIKDGTLLHIKKISEDNEETWEYAFKFSTDGPVLRLWIDEGYSLVIFISKRGKKEFSLTDYIRHISNRSEAYKYSKMHLQGKITKKEKLEFTVKRREGLLGGELGEILRGEKWIDIPDYTWNDYK